MRRILLYLYAAWCVLLFVLTLPVATLVVALLALPNTLAARIRIWKFLKGWALFYLFFTGRNIRKMNRPERSGSHAVVVLNHQSYLDSVLLFPAVPGYFRPLGKIEISRIPLFGFIYRQITLLVDRSSNMSRARSMKLMKDALLAEGHIAIFPEGTFNETDEPLLPFHDGAFRLAVAAQASVLPVLMPDTNERWNGTNLWLMSPGRNRVYYLPEVSTKGLTVKDIPALREKIAAMMAEKLMELKAM